MLKIKEYVRAQSLDEAYSLYQKRSSVILGGMLWLKMQNRSVGAAIDLSDLHLDTVEETEDAFRIGAMTTLRTLETHPGLNELTQGAFGACLSPIVGVQFRNLATIGGSICGKFGFSDPLTLLLALGAQVELYHRGTVSLEEFLDLPSQRDILVRLILPKGELRAAYLSQRNTATDFPVLTCGLCRRNGVLSCAVGSRPGRAQLLRVSSGACDARQLAEELTEQITFGSNTRASAEYREKICRVLIRRGLEQLEEKA